MTIVIGPWGGNGGADWDDGIYNGVREIKIAYCLCIDSITVGYDRNGKPVKAETHSGRGGNQTAEIKLQYPDEFLVGVSGLLSDDVWHRPAVNPVTQISEQ
ncbi:hypothetical protein L3X38_016144 [Prunus dulcis]|uniref:Jacalin-type lectin domain-containing protein n=1 Tax=Prunus dulcis TaxID=3755 RepID=A0AAD4W4S5_PRUDU|nr:hypothetical protein L3X38_016144 [Prunus dulcis]